MYPSSLSVLVAASIIVILLCLGSKYVEYLGIMPVRSGSIFAPYGKLIEAKKLSEESRLSKKAIFGKAFLAAGVAALLLLPCMLFAGAAFRELGLATVSLAAAFFARDSLGFPRAFCYALAGALLVGGLLISLLAFVVYNLPFDMFGLAGKLGLLVGFTFAVGAAFGVTFAPKIDRFERRFEDGHTDVICLSAHTKASRKLEALSHSIS